jgi:hypothetical protein
VIFVDLASGGGHNSDGLFCPPANFVTPAALALMRGSLRPGRGVLAFNLVTRNSEVSGRVKAALLEFVHYFILFLFLIHLKI